MPTHKPGKIEDGQDGLEFAAALRDCFVSGMAIVDSGHDTVILNREAELMLGLAAAAAQPVPLGSLPAPLADALRKFAAAPETAAMRQTRVALPNRGVLSLAWSCLSLPITPSPGRAFLVRDLSPLKKLEYKVWRMDRLANIGTLSASMAHEIKNALVAGKTFIDLLLEKHQDAELVDIVRREMARIDSIVSRMLNFVGQARPAFAPVNLHESLEHSLRLAQPQLESKAIVLTRSFSAAPEIVDGDDHELQQAFVNLFLNAMEAMEPNGTLAVATDTVAANAGSDGGANPLLRVTIRDSGSGISPHDMDRLFEPFFTTKPEGTGLGLPITQRIIHEHHGDIEVESHVGEGTTFRITLPAMSQS